MLKNSIQKIMLLLMTLTLSACGFHLRGPMQLALPLHRMHIQAEDPYSVLVRTLREYLKTSGVQLAASAQEAETNLVILTDTPTQQLLSVSGTQLSRQYILYVTVVFEITDTKGRVLLGPETLTESRTITIQSNQILGSSNEANLFYQQMRRAIAYALMNRIASTDVAKRIMTTLHQPPSPTLPV